MKDDRKRLCKEDYVAIGSVCSNCGSNEELQYHHIIPLNAGGKNIRSNIVCLCGSCHDLVHGITRKGYHNESVKKGIKEAKAKGKHVGKPFSQIYTMPQVFDELYLRHINEGLSVVEMAEILNVSKTAVYKYMSYRRENEQFNQHENRDPNLPDRTQKISKKQTEFDELYQRFIRKEITADEMARTLNVSTRTIYYNINKKNCNEYHQEKSRGFSNTIEFQQKLDVYYPSYINGELSIDEIAKLLNVSASTVSKYINMKRYEGLIQKTSENESDEKEKLVEITIDYIGMLKEKRYQNAMFEMSIISDVYDGFSYAGLVEQLYAISGYKDADEQAEKCKQQSIQVRNNKSHIADTNVLTRGCYNYCLHADGTAEILKYTGAAELIEIPSSFDNHNVGCIKFGAFGMCRTLKSIILPPNFVNIEDGFGFGLTNIYVDTRNPKYADIDGVLFDKTKRVLVSYPSNRTDLCYKIPDSTLFIRGRAFYGNNFIEEVITPEGLKGFCFAAFFGCFKITNITIPKSVTNIGSYAFYGCSLIDIYIPNNVTFVGSIAFGYQSNITNIHVDDQNSLYKDINGVLFQTDQKMLHTYPAGKKESIYIIPAHTQMIRSNAFYMCDNLEHIEIPYSIRYIAEDSFTGCNKATLFVCKQSYAENYVKEKRIPYKIIP
jgi:predicted transcriptional regulator